MTMYLGLDYGTKHIGVALADGPLASPVTSLDMEPTKALGELAHIVDDNHVEKIVIGLPEGKMDDEVRRFGDKLQKMTGVSVAYHPETLSTQEAIANLRAGRANKSKLMNDHVYAACLILEDYLETNEAPLV